MVKLALERVSLGVHSVGIDVTEVQRIQQVIDRYGKRFLERVFTRSEIAYCSGKSSYAQNYAARFAAKEAVFKAAGTGLSPGMSWQDVEVINDELGKPELLLHGATAQLLEGKVMHLSLTHTRAMAIAMVVVGENKP